MIKVVLWAGMLKEKLVGERGAGLAEYALLLFVVAVAGAITVGAFGDNIIAAFQDATDSLPAGEDPAVP